MTASDAAGLWQALHEARPLAARLALRSCLPVRVTPSLLRLARLKLLPHAGTGEEADVWLSDLVESRTAVGFSYRRAVREHLRRELARDPALLAEVWRQVHLAQSNWQTPRARLEEELTWRLMRDRADPEIERHWQAVLQTLDAGPDAEGLARWVMRAVPDLPEGALDSPAAQRAWQGAHLMLGDAGVLGEATQTFLASSDFAFATRRLPRRRVQVGLLEGGGLVSPLQNIENGHAIDVPATRPLWLQLEDDTGTPLQVLTLSGMEPQQWATDRPATVIRGIDGAAYRLAPLQDPGNSRQKPIAKARQPRVHITYDVELSGGKKIELPFVIGVMADLSGKPSEPLPAIADRRFLEIDLDNFDDKMKGLRPRVAFPVPNVLTGEGEVRVDLEFERLDDFLPMAVLQRLEPLRLLLEASENLANLPGYLDRRPEARELLARALGERDGLIGARTLRALKDDFERQRSKLHHLLSEQLNLVLHHEDLRKIESAWRGLHHLVRHTETNETLKIRVLNLAKSELADALRPTEELTEGQTEEEAWDKRSPLFKKIYEEEYGQFGGEPYLLLVGDYLFDHFPPDVEVLRAMARLAAAAHAPFLAGASPTLMQLDSWQELEPPRDFTKMIAWPEYAAWRELRESDDARFVGLAMPGFLARAPYVAGSSPAEAFAFQETLDADSGSEGRVWANAAYAMAANIGRAFSQYGWCARIRGVESGGLVEALPTLAWTPDDGVAGSVEFAIPDRLEAELSRLGLMPLVQLKNAGMAAFIGANSLHQPAQHDDPDAAVTAQLAAKWHYLLTCTRFVHYLKCIVREKIGAFRQDEEAVHWLNEWLMNYVAGEQETLSEEMRVERPLAAAQVVLQKPSERQGFVTVRIFLRPHYQLEGLNRPLELLTRLPSQRSV